MKLFLLLVGLIFSPGTKELKTKDGGLVKYYDTECYGSDGTNCDIVVEKYLNKQLKWKTVIGGNSWDYVEDVIEVEDGFLVLGNTGSFGVGNNDVYLTKLDLNGNEKWYRTYGGFFNDYGRKIRSSNDYYGGYIITGEKQHCLTQNVSEKCYTEGLYIRVNEFGDNLVDNY